jgi:hypothetical protein
VVTPEVGGWHHRYDRQAASALDAAHSGMEAPGVNCVCPRIPRSQIQFLRLVRVLVDDRLSVPLLLTTRWVLGERQEEIPRLWRAPMRSGFD